MRIRTIKPEFWASETIAPLSDKAKLLAIGLLNFADDEGYFWANPVLIRAALFPFEDESKTILGWLQELSGAGYICLGKRGDDGRAVGRVINFTIHQRIDKPKPSIIKQNSQFQDESTTHPITIQDESCLERKGKEGNREGNGCSPAAEIQSELECVAMTQAAGIPKEFSSYVYQDWSSRAGKDAGGVVVSFLPYVTKRWARESVEWRSGKHNGKKKDAAIRPVGGVF